MGSNVRTALLVPLLAGCAAGPSISTSAPRPLIENQPVRGTDRFRVVTNGLPIELAVEGVEAGDRILGKDVLEATLTALDGHAPVPGLDLEIALGRARAPVKLIRATGGELWVVDVPPTGDTASPLRALATAAVARAALAREASEPEAAWRLAVESVRLFPGDPLLASGARGRAGELNLQNHLAWAVLASLSDGADQERFLIAAVERSPAFLAARLGAWPEELLEPTTDELALSARDLVREILSSQEKVGLSSGVVEIRSPVLDSWGRRPQAVLPRPFLDLYFQGEAAAALREGPLVDLAVQAFERLRGDPIELLLATSEIRSLYLEDDPFQPAPEPGGNEAWRPMLSALLADVARKAAAGLTPEEITASLHGEAAPEAKANALVKMSEQRERESSWYAQALRSVEE